MFVKEGGSISSLNKRKVGCGISRIGSAVSNGLRGWKGRLDDYQVLRKCIAGVMSHGGIGSVAGCVHKGTPLLR